MQSFIIFSVLNFFYAISVLKIITYFYSVTWLYASYHVRNFFHSLYSIKILFVLYTMFLVLITHASGCFTGACRIIAPSFLKES